VEAPETDNSGHAVWYPLWTEEGCALPAEYFNAEEAKKCSNKDAKNVSFAPFQDPCGRVFLPAPLACKIAKWARIEELYTECEVKEGDTAPVPTLVSAVRQKHVIHPRPIGASEKLWLRKKQLTYPERIAEPLVGLGYGNDHLMESELIRTSLAYFSDLQVDPTPFKSGGFLAGAAAPNTANNGGGAAELRPWELIYPQGKNDDGVIMPIYNKSGKYIVRLFWMGSWRKVTIDDYVPLDAGGNWLLPRSSLEDELWPALITKAIMKLTSLSYEREVGKSEFGDAKILQMLTGWQTELAPIGSTTEDHHRVAHLLHRLVQPVAEEKPKSSVADADVAAAAAAADAEAASEVTASATKKKGKKERQSTTIGLGGDCGDDGPPAPRQPSAATPKKMDCPHCVPTECICAPTRRAAFVDASFVAGCELPDGCGFESSQAHPVRVLGCFYLDPSGRPSSASNGQPDFSNADSWVVKCSSHSMLYNGGLAYGDDEAWHMSVQASLGVCRDTELAEQEHALAQHAKGESHPAFAWHMRLSEFCSVFKTLNVHHRVSDLQTIILEAAEGAPATTAGTAIRYVPELPLTTPPPADKKGEVPLNFSQEQPHYFCIDSLKKSQVVVSFGVTPNTQPRYPGDQPETEPVDPTEPEVTPAAPADGDGADGEGADGFPTLAEPEKLPLPQNGTAFIESFVWNDSAPPAVALNLFTNSTACGVINLQPGRHIFRIRISSQHSYALTISSQQEITLNEEEKIVGMLDGSSVRLQESVTTTCQALQMMLLNYEKADEVIRLVAISHLKEHKDGEKYSTLFFQSLLWALQVSFGPDWTRAGKNGETESAEARAWIRHVGDLQKRSADFIQELKVVAAREQREQHDAEAAAAKAAAEEARMQQLHSNDLTGFVNLKTPPEEIGESVVSFLDNVNDSLNDDTDEFHQEASRRLSKKPSMIMAMCELDACRAIQRSFRSYRARNVVAAKREEVLANEKPLITESWEKIGADVLQFGVLLFRRMFDIDRSLLADFAFGADELQRAKLSDFRGQLEEKPANQVFALFKDVFRFSEETDCLAQFRVVVPPSEDPTVPAVSSDVFQLLITNNDTLEAVPSSFARPTLHKFEPNTHGYTFMAIGRSPVPIPKLDWALRVLSFPDFPCEADRTLTMTIEPKTETGAARPMTTPGSACSEIDPDTGETLLKYDVLFRYDLEIAAVQELVGLSLSVDPIQLPDAVMYLQVLEEGVELEAASAKHFVVFPRLRMKGVPRSEEAGEDDKGGKGGKGGKDAKARGKSAKDKDKKPTPTAAAKAPSATLDVGDAPVEPAAPPPPPTKYTVIGRLLSGGTPAQLDAASAAPVEAKKPDKGKKKPKSAGGGGHVDGPAWTLQIVSESPDLITITPNHSREDEIKEKKVGWEAVASANGEEGRADKAKDLRTDFVTAPDPDAPKPALTVGPDPRFLAEAEKAVQAGSFESMLEESKKTSPAITAFDMALDTSRRNARAAMQTKYRTERDTLLSRRGVYSATRRDNHKSELGQFTQLREARASTLETRGALRAAYRQRILDEAAAKKNADDARLSALQAENLALEVAMEGADRPASRAGDKKKKK
jgi:hypothetical protein